jgi:hypothetical protein
MEITQTSVNCCISFQLKANSGLKNVRVVRLTVMAENSFDISVSWESDQPGNQTVLSRPCSRFGGAVETDHKFQTIQLPL